jgi:hypothetical protein
MKVIGLGAPASIRIRFDSHEVDALSAASPSDCASCGPTPKSAS